MSTLDSFVKSTRPRPKSLATSQEVRDRGSTFVANVYRATTPEEARTAVNHLKHVVHGSKLASHEIAAWRYMVLKHGRSGLGGPDDFELKTGSDEDGETWAGGKVLNVMQAEGVIDAVVIVSRWFGGTLLGPARFTHIETCALEVCRAFKRKEEVEECVSTLSTLDDILADLRADLTSASTADGNPSRTTSSSQKKPDYAAMLEEADLSKLKRLVSAREKAVASIKALLAKKGAQMVPPL